MNAMKNSKLTKKGKSQFTTWLNSNLPFCGHNKILNNIEPKLHFNWENEVMVKQPIFHIWNSPDNIQRLFLKQALQNNLTL